MFQGKKCGALILQRSLCVKSIKLLCKMRPASQIFIRETEKPRLKEEKKKASKQNRAAIEQLVLHSEVVPALNRKAKREAELCGCCYWASLYLNTGNLTLQQQSL